MKPFKFHKEAERRADEIWRYSFSNFGKKKADSYISEITNTIKDICKEKVVGRPYLEVERLNLDVMHILCNKHYIFYIVKSEYILIITILHSSMDLPTQLNKIKL